MPIVDHYGQTERVAMAGSCEAGGYHEFPDYGIIELIPVEGRTDRWEIVGTPLHNWGFPVVPVPHRRRGRARPDGSCPCGRAFPTARPDRRTRRGRLHRRERTGPALAWDVVDESWPGFGRCKSRSWLQVTSSFRLVPTVGSDIVAAEEQARQNVEKFFGPLRP